VLLLAVALAGCTGPAAQRTVEDHATMRDNPVHYFEIPVTDLDRAVAFYSALFGFALERTVVDGYEMALLPRADGAPGASGALAKGDVYVPSMTGAIVYFSVDDLDPVLARAEALGAEVLYPKKSIGPNGFVAEIRDSEGNRLALHALAD
jgi:predicted enzyme related to lactoylglutathione lyase